MSANAGKGSGSKTDDVLSAILKSLKELGAQLRSMETRLESMESIKDKVSTLEASTSELGTQQDMLSVVIERVNLAHTEHDAKVSHVETAQRELPHDRAPNSGRCR
jgi:chromosome segregation ATPase